MLHRHALPGAADRGRLPRDVRAAPTRVRAAAVAGSGRRSRAAEEALSLSHAVGERGLAAAPMAWLTLLAALQGRDDYHATPRRARGRQRHPPPRRARRPRSTTSPIGRRPPARADLSDHVGALDHLRHIRTPAITRMVPVERITAAVRAGDRELATTWLADFAPFARSDPVALGGHRARTTPRPCSPTTTLRADSLPARPSPHGRPGSRPYDRARTQLAYGELLRRSRSRTEARPHLRAALDDVRGARRGTVHRLALRPSCAPQARRPASETPPQRCR